MQLPVSTDYASNAVACKLWGLVDSPTELLFGLALFERLNGFYERWRCWIYSEQEYAALLQSEDFEKRRGSFVIIPQPRFETIGRVDFAIFIPGLSSHIPLVVIECDGHQFHERTVQQASKDRKRDRELQKYGIPSLRFTGTDIVRSSVEMAQEVADFLDLHADEKEFRAFQDRGIDLTKGFKAGDIAPYPWPRIKAGSALAASTYGSGPGMTKSLR